MREVQRRIYPGGGPGVRCGGGGPQVSTSVLLPTLTSKKKISLVGGNPCAVEHPDHAYIRNWGGVSSRLSLDFVRCRQTNRRLRPWERKRRKQEYHHHHHLLNPSALPGTEKSLKGRQSCFDWPNSVFLFLLHILSPFQRVVKPTTAPDATLTASCSASSEY